MGLMVLRKQNSDRKMIITAGKQNDKVARNGAFLAFKG